MLRLFDQSTLFDPEWYQHHYPDVASSGVDPARHYLLFGWKEGRDPGPGFSTSAYLRANADVAALGINPLLHYVEHGYTEGRGVGSHAAPVRPSLAPVANYGPAAPCASFPRSVRPSVRWCRRARPEADPENVELIDGYFIGEHRDAQSRVDFASLANVFASLSGAATAHAPSDHPVGQVSTAHLIDAWHAGQGSFRTRWRSSREQPLIVRAVQFVRDHPSLVGEGPVTGPLDPFDANLVNQFFPVLFVFSTPDGWIEGWEILAFPSLCRGGLHYPELLALTDAGEDGRAIHHELLQRLVAVNRSDAVPVIAGFQVDLRGADGTHPLFQPDFKQWLARVARLHVRALQGSPSETGTYLTEKLSVDPKPPRGGGGVELVLPSDMVPSVSLIVAESSVNACPAPTVFSFIVTGEEPSFPSTLMTVPADLPDDLPCDHIPLFPRLVSRPDTAARTPLDRAIALRLPRRQPLSEAELLMPMARVWSGSAPGVDAITVIVPVADWTEGELSASLQALSLQSATAPLTLLFVGAATPSITELAERLFERITCVVDVAAAAAKVATSLVAYLGPGILLHDRRALATLAKILSDPGVASASLVLIAMERRGKAKVLAPVDAGDFGDAVGDQIAKATVSMWRSTLPQSRPPRDFWMTRTADLKDWIAHPEAAVRGRHMCTSLVTGTSRASNSRRLEAAMRPPRAIETMRMRLLVG